jgi:addiction module HigA family antidote
MNRNLHNQYQPEDVSPPGETLQELLDERGMSVNDLSEKTQIAAHVIKQILKGKAEITHDMSLQLERVFDVPARFWDNRERHYRKSLAKNDRKRLRASSK